MTVGLVDTRVDETTSGVGWCQSAQMFRLRQGELPGRPGGWDRVHIPGFRVRDQGDIEGQEEK